MWSYKQLTGDLSCDGVHVGSGYSGHGRGKNNPALENVENIGPIPKGKYTIGSPFTHDRKGPICMRLTPDRNNKMYGRAGFMIHGDSIKNPGTASEGCVILDRKTRLFIAAHGDRNFMVE